MKMTLNPASRCTLFVLLALFLPAAAIANDFTEAKVVKVYDGDTIEVAIGYGSHRKVEKVRLIGIDCPESWENEKFERDMKRGTPYTREEMLELGRQARELAEKLCPPGSKVLLGMDWRERDKYGRLLAQVAVFRPPWNWSHLNSEMIKAGFARAMIIPPGGNYAEDFRKLESEARERRLGIWSKEW